jgi:hypothetical protein
VNLSACVFIRNNSAGFCLYESMAMVLPLVEQFIILDLESTDGTWETLQEIARHNPKVELHRKPWPHIDAGVFATLANELVAMCDNERVWYYQADEILHEDLIPIVKQRLEAGQPELAFWRIQYRENFQRVKWFPHLVHRLGLKGQFNFVGDGMTTDRTWDARICSDYGGEYFPQWGGMGEEGIKPYVGQMLMDVSQLGGFRDNIIDRRVLHAPFWHESTHIEGQSPDEWAERALANPNWTKQESPFNLPAIMRYHVGKVRYELRPALLEALKADKTEEYLNELVGRWK